MTQEAKPVTAAIREPEAAASLHREGNTRLVMMQLDYLVMIAGKTAEIRQGEGCDGKMKYWCNLSNDRSVYVNKTEYDFICYLRSKTNQHEEK